MKRLNKTGSSTSCSSNAFTLIEIMTVVAIIGILAAVAIPNYLQHVRRSQRNACVSNLIILSGAMEQCRLGGFSETITMNMLCEPTGYIKTEPRCPFDKSQPYDISGVIPHCPNVGSSACSEHVCP